MRVTVFDRINVLLGIILVGFVTTVASVHIGSALDEFRYRLSVPKGERYRFKITSTMVQNGRQVPGMDAILVQEITDVKDDKTTMTAYYEKFGTPGTDMPEMISDMLLGMRITVIVDERGRTVEMKVTGAGMMGDAILKQIMLTLPFPDKPLKPGDTWEEEATVFGMRSKTKYTFVGFDKYKDKSAAVIQFQPMGGHGVESADYKMWIEPSSGIMFKLEGMTRMSRPAGTSVVLFERLER